MMDLTPYLGMPLREAYSRWTAAGGRTNFGEFCAEKLALDGVTELGHDVSCQISTTTDAQEPGMQEVRAFFDRHFTHSPGELTPTVLVHSLWVSESSMPMELFHRFRSRIRKMQAWGHGYIDMAPKDRKIQRPAPERDPLEDKVRLFFDEHYERCISGRVPAADAYSLFLSTSKSTMSWERFDAVRRELGYKYNKLKRKVMDARLPTEQEIQEVQAFLNEVCEIGGVEQASRVHALWCDSHSMPVDRFKMVCKELHIAISPGGECGMYKGLHLTGQQPRANDEDVREFFNANFDHDPASCVPAEEVHRLWERTHSMPWSQFHSARRALSIALEHGRGYAGLRRKSNAETDPSI